MNFVMLVVAKAPVPRLVKTRLCPPATPEQAAEIAAAALLDTLDAVHDTPGAVPVVALTGNVRRDDVGQALARVEVIPQRGWGLADRLAHAHADVASRHPGLPVLQIGMDTPQVTPALLAESAARLADVDAVLGMATDGGWWGLGLREPSWASALLTVPMSTSITGALTVESLHRKWIEVGSLPMLSDVDTMADARQVAASLPRSRFATAVSAVAEWRAEVTEVAG